MALIYTRILENPNQQLDWYFNRLLLVPVFIYQSMAAFFIVGWIKRIFHCNCLIYCVLMSSQLLRFRFTFCTFFSMYFFCVALIKFLYTSNVYKHLLFYLQNCSVFFCFVFLPYFVFQNEKAKEFKSKIIGFETAIKRPYFHEWPLFEANYFKSSFLTRRPSFMMRLYIFFTKFQCYAQRCMFLMILLCVDVYVYIF